MHHSHERLTERRVFKAVPKTCSVGPSSSDILTVFSAPRFIYCEAYHFMTIYTLSQTFFNAGIVHHRSRTEMLPELILS